VAARQPPGGGALEAPRPGLNRRRRPDPTPPPQKNTTRPPGNIIGKTQTLTLFVESAYKEYNSEAAFAAAVLLSLLALATLWVKDQVEKAAAAEAAK
jgi:hypothetical protein